MKNDHPIGTFYGPATFVDLVRHRAKHQPNDLVYRYLVDGEGEEEQITCLELDRRARAIAAWLLKEGMTGGRALLLFPAGLEFITAFFGCLYAGVTAVPIYPPRRNRSMIRIQAVADDCHACVALTTQAVLDRVEPLIDETPNLKELRWVSTCDIPDRLRKSWERPNIKSDSIAFLQYTSGSTGSPKGVVLNHANLLHNSALIYDSFEHTRSDSGVYWLPAYHDMGLIGGILQPLFAGLPNTFMSPMNFLQKPFRWLQAISKYKGTISGGPNFAYDLCVRKVQPAQLAQLDLSSWKVAFNGAEPVRPETLNAFAEKFAPCGFRREAFYPCFGMAEATLIISGGWVKDQPIIRTFESAALASGQAIESTNGNGEHVRALAGSGQKLRDGDIRIVDPDLMTELAEGLIGEIWAASPSVAKGYWKQPEITEVTFNAHLADSGEGPFLRTGDLGFMLGGELFVTGRVKDLIIVRGVNHYPHDIEQTVQKANKRLRVDCGGVFSIESHGHPKVIAVQEVSRAKTVDFGELFDVVRKAVALEHDLLLEDIVFIKAGTIPKTSSGKIQRHACRRGYIDGTLTVLAKWSDWEGSETAESNLPTLRSEAAEQFPELVKEFTYDGPTMSEEEQEGDTTVDFVDEEEVKPSRLAGAKVLDPVTRRRLTEVVAEEIRKIAKDRANGLTLDTPIVETGLDSLERMEILAGIEERFGGRFPAEILPDLETTNMVVDAVAQYLGTEPREKNEQAAAREILPEEFKIDSFPEVVRLRQTMSAISAMGLRNPFFDCHQGVISDRTMIDGREMVSFSAYNYLNLSGHPAVSKASKEAIDQYGTSASASRLVAGQKDLHLELEEEIADFIGTEEAMVLVGGHATNESVIGHLMGPGDLILHDALAHNSIIQGAILSGARRRPFRHNDWEAAEEVLRNFRHEYRRVLIVIEGVYSMDGDFPELPRFIELRNKYKSLLMIDEAHSIGVLGEKGHGIGEQFDVDRTEVDIWMGTLSKTLASSGGYIAGSRTLCQYMKYTTPGFVFAGGISPPCAAASLAALRVIRDEPQRVERLRKNCRLFLDTAREAQLDVGLAMGTAVVPVILGSSALSLAMSNALAEVGYNVMPILHPAVEEHATRLRFFITADHSEEQIRGAIAATVEQLGILSKRFDYAPATSCSEE